MLSTMVAYCAVMLAAVGFGPLVATTTESAAAAAYYDAVRIPPQDACFMRYIWWDSTWENYELFTKVTQALISNERDFPNPVRVCPYLMRLDLRESGHQKFLHVWERFRNIEFSFHVKKKSFKGEIYTTYHPAGYYDTYVGGSTTSRIRKWYDFTTTDEVVKPGEIVIVPAPWANPLVQDHKKPELKVEALTELRRLLHTEVPILWGPFWMVRVQRQIDITNKVLGIGYYEWFGYEDKDGTFITGIKNRNDYFKVLAVDEKEFIKRLRELRAYIQKSDVSEQSRQIVVLDEKTWGTLDTFTQKEDVANDEERGNPALNLRRNEFRHNAERWIGRKADGFYLNGLFAANGDLQNTAPDQIGPDTSSINITKDKRIGPDNCMHCHGILKRNYIIDFDDVIRNNVTEAKKTFIRGKSRDEELELTAYLRSLDLAIRQNREAFSNAIQRLTRDPRNPKDPGMTMDQFTRWYRSDGYYKYVAPKDGVTWELAEKWMGVPPKSLKMGLEAIMEARGALDPISGMYTFKKPIGVRTLDFENNYQYWQVTARRIQAPELFIRVKGFDSSPKGKKP